MNSSDSRVLMRGRAWHLTRRSAQPIFGEAGEADPLMELRQLEHFVAVVDEQHFTRAARKCHISQSALSASIRSLEREFDAALYTRTTRRVEVTEAGRALADQARTIISTLAAARDAVSATTGQLTGVLRVV